MCFPHLSFRTQDCFCNFGPGVLTLKPSPKQCFQQNLNLVRHWKLNSLSRLVQPNYPGHSSQTLTLIPLLQMAKQEEEDPVEQTYRNYRNTVIPSLPTKKGCWLNENLYQYRGFWLRPSHGLEAVLWMQHNFEPRPTDILLATSPKSGTTWLKALAFSVVNRTRCSIETHPLLDKTPHQCVPFLDLHLLRTAPISDPELMESPRIMGCHVAYSVLPEKVKTLEKGCKIVYMCREPKDVLVSIWKFLSDIKGSMMVPEKVPPLTLDLAVEMFCRGDYAFGPFWDHVLEYWKASLERPDKVLFMKYEDWKNDGKGQLRKLAAFLGQPFSGEEEEKGGVDEILELCSFESMSNMEVNRKGVNKWGVKHAAFFRQGKVGDWKNHLTPEMVGRIDRITREKFEGSGLTLP